MLAERREDIQDKMIIRHNLPCRARFFHSLTGIAALLLALLAALIASPEPASAQATPTVPGEPTGVMVTPGDTGLTVSWNAPTNDGGSQITGYLIEYTTGGAYTLTTYRLGEVFSLEVEPSVRSQEITGLQNGKVWTLQVTAMNAVGSGTSSSTVDSKPLATNVPSAPVLVSVSPGNGVLTVTWTGSSDNGSIGNEGLRYSVRIKSSSKDWGDPSDDEAGTYNHYDEVFVRILANIKNGISHDVVVRSHNTRGISPRSNVIQATPVAPPGTVPDAPRLNRVVAGDAQITVNWTAPLNEGSSPITGYLVQYLHSVCVVWSVSPVVPVPLNFEVGPSVRSHVITGLQNGDQYCVRVTAVNDEGQSEPAKLFYSVIPTGAPDAPTITSVFVGDGSLNVIWTPPRHDGGEEIERYEVEYKQATEDDTMWTAADDTTSPSLITGLVNGTTYNVRVRAVNAIGGGDWAESVGTPAATSIRTVTADATGDGTADVTVSVDNPDNTTVYIQYRLIGASDTLTTLGPKTATSASPDVTFNLSGLTPAARYTLKATLVDGDYTNSSPLVFATNGEFKQGHFQQTIFPTHAIFWIGTTGVSGSRTIHFRYQVEDSETWITLSPQTITGLEDASFYLTGLESNTRYDIEISTAPSWPSGATISRFFRTVPFKPTGLTLKAGDQRIDATWDSLTERHTPFVVEWKEDGDNWLFGSSRSNYVYGTEYTITGLENGKTYDVRVRSRNAGGYSQWSDVESLTPQNLVGISVQDAAITSSGATVTVTLDDAIATLVYLRYKKSSDTPWGSTLTSQPQTGSSLSVDFMLSGLVAGTAYDVEASLDSSGFTNPQTTSFTTLAPLSSDATLSALTLSEVDFGTFASDTEIYTAEVVNDPTETTVTPTVNHSGATYVIKIGGVTDSDGTVPLANGDNLITVEVTAEDRATKKTYTVTVTRLVTSEQTEASTDATLSGLILSGVDFGTFASDTETYTAEVVNDPTETTVTPTVNHSGATYVIKIGGVTDSDGTVPLANGDNLITVEVTAEDRATKKTYTVTVTRLVTSEQTEASTDATLSGLILSGVDFGTFASDTETYTADVAYSVSQTTVTPTLNDSDASYVIKLDGTVTVDADGTVPLEVGSNTIAVEVTAEDNTTEKTYTVTVTRAPPSTDATLSALTLTDVDFGTFVSVTETYTASVANSVSRTTVTPLVNHSSSALRRQAGRRYGLRPRNTPQRGQQRHHQSR